MSSDSSPLVPDAPHDPPAARAAPRVRLAAPADARWLAEWLQAAQPLPVAAARARHALVEGLLARPERGACVVAQDAQQGLLGCLPVALVPHLGLGGLAAFAAEWWARPAAAQAEPLLACCSLLADWCQAHGVRHLLLSPALLTPPQAAAAGFVPHAGGLWHRNLSPAPKHLG